MIDMYVAQKRITSKSGITGILSTHRERGTNGVYVVEYEAEGDIKIPEKYQRAIERSYTLFNYRRKLKRPCCSICADYIHLEVDIKGCIELFEIVKKILSQ